jgi:hypothetical protein
VQFFKVEMSKIEVLGWFDIIVLTIKPEMANIKGCKTSGPEK